MLERDEQQRKKAEKSWWFIEQEKKKIKEAKEDKENLGKIKFLIKDLPLEECQREINPMTKKWGWLAPENKIFRISGAFLIETHQSEHDMGQYPPVPSQDYIKNKHPESYKRILKEVKNKPPIFFEGKWLNFSLGPKPFLYVESDVNAEYDPSAYIHNLNDINPESEMITACSFGSPIGETLWTQEYAEPILDSCKIELVDFTEKEKKLYAPKASDKNQLCYYKNKDFEYSIYHISLKKRPGKKQEKELKGFMIDNKGFSFYHPDEDESIYKPSKISLAFEKRKKLILPEK